MRIKHNKCLVLNSDYSPLCVISWKRAMVWSIKYQTSSNMGIEIIDFYKNDFIRGANDKRFPVPAVVRVTHYRKHTHNGVNFSRKNLFMRDDFTCQYCGIIYDVNNLTYDHVVPKSQWDYSKSGTPTTWTNIVTSCLHCNRRKGNRTPKQANMPLLNLPHKPVKSLKYLPLRSYLLKIKEEIPVEWETYLPRAYIA